MLSSRQTDHFSLDKRRENKGQDSQPNLDMVGNKFLTYLPPRFHLLISEPSLMFQGDSVQCY